MFAGCIESRPITFGNRLIALASSEHGLANIPYDYAGQLQSGQLTVVEQSQCRHQYAKRYNNITQHSETGVIIAGWLRIDNRDELHKSLVAVNSYNSGSLKCDHDLVLAAYLKWGDRVSEFLVGDFSLVVHDPRSRSTILIRDQIGSKPLYYYCQNGLFVFSTSIAVIQALLPKERLELNQRWLALYLLNNAQDWRETAYQQILKVPSAHALFFSGGKVLESRYFEFNPQSHLVLTHDMEYVEAYREILDEAIRCRAMSDCVVGAESSGGMDSSTITAMASNHIENPKHNYHTFGFDCCEQDSKCIAAVSQSTSMCATHIISEGFPLNNVEPHSYKEFTECVGVPCEHYSPLSHTPLLQLARQVGVRSMLSGFGGDEFVTSFAALTRVELWETTQWRDWLNLFHGNNFTSPLRAMKWLYRYKKTNNCFETAHQLKKATERSWQNNFINHDLCEQYSLKELTLKSANYDNGYTKVNEFALGNRWSPQMSARMENSSLYAARYGIEYNWPLLDVRLINFFLSVPAKQKLGPGGIGRYLHRRAIKGTVPDLIVNKTKEMGPTLNTNSAPLFDLDTDFPTFNKLPPQLAELIDQVKYERTVADIRQQDNCNERYRSLINFVSLRRWLELQEN